MGVKRWLSWDLVGDPGSGGGGSWRWPEVEPVELWNDPERRARAA